MYWALSKLFVLLVSGGMFIQIAVSKLGLDIETKFLLCTWSLAVNIIDK